MVRQVRFLVSVEEVAEESPRGRGRSRRARPVRATPRRSEEQRMKLHDLRPAEGSRTERTRVGRGIAAGKGKTAGRGTKGQKARAGGSIPPWFEGGQTPLHIRIPKLRGFSNRCKVEYEIVNVGDIDAAVERGAFETARAPRPRASRRAAPRSRSTRTSCGPSDWFAASTSRSRSSVPASCARPCSSWPTRSRARREPRSRPPAAA